ncbi:MAG: hypothetical protein ABGZ53_35060 [Fuerstiella sp.]
MAKGKSVRIEFEIPESFADRLKSVVREEGVPAIDQMSDWCREHVLGYFGDKRRTAVAIKRVPIYWKLDLYEAMIDHAGSGGVPGFVRESVHQDLREQGVKGLSPLPVWREVRQRNAKKRASKGKARSVKKYKEGPDDHQKDHYHPVAVPEDWWFKIDELWPKEVSTFIMSCAQARLQVETDQLYVAKRTMKAFLTEFAED